MDNGYMAGWGMCLDTWMLCIAYMLCIYYHSM